MGHAVDQKVFHDLLEEPVVLEDEGGDCNEVENSEVYACSGLGTATFVEVHQPFNFAYEVVLQSSQLFLARIAGKDSLYLTAHQVYGTGELLLTELFLVLCFDG